MNKTKSKIMTNTDNDINVTLDQNNPELVENYIYLEQKITSMRKQREELN